MNIKWLTMASGFFLLLGVLNWPYDYYVLLRIFICISSSILSFRFYNRQNTSWAFTFGIIAFLFNPVLPVHLTKSIWVVLDIIAAFIFFYSSTIINKVHHDK